jgi:hypothetical protein
VAPHLDVVAISAGRRDEKNDSQKVKRTAARSRVRESFSWRSGSPVRGILLKMWWIERVKQEFEMSSRAWLQIVMISIQDWGLRSACCGVNLAAREIKV